MEFSPMTSGLVFANAFGARGDGLALCTSAIQAAIDDAQARGGTVCFEPGTYLTGALFLKSGVTLRVDKDVCLLGSRNLADYPVLATRVAGIEMPWPAALINVYRQESVRLEGEGTIDGDGKIWWDAYWSLRRDYEPRGLRWAADYDCQRPRLIQIFESSNVSLSSLQLKRSGFWTVHICYSEGVRVADIVIRNNIGGRGPSTDGIDIDSSRNVVVERADLSCNDDAICIKSGRDWDGLRVARPTEDVVIRDCVVRDGAAGVTFGSETSGGFRNIEVSGLRAMFPVAVGIRFKSSATRGGTLENIRIHDVHLQDVRTVFRVDFNWNPAYSLATIPPGIADVPPIWRTLAQPVSRERGLPRVHDVEVRNLQAVGAWLGFDATAFPEAPMCRFRFEGLRLDVREAGRIANAQDWTFVDSEIAGLDGTLPSVSDSTGVVFNGS
jgi:polygalacturonase